MTARCPWGPGYRQTTGEHGRCLVGSGPWPDRLCLCPRHSRSLQQALVIDGLSYSERVRWARCLWHNTSDLR